MREKCNFLQSADLNFKHFPFSVYHGATPWSLKVKQMLKKLNLWGKRAVDKSAWIKTCPTSNPEVIRSLEIRLRQQYQLKFQWDLNQEPFNSFSMLQPTRQLSPSFSITKKTIQIIDKQPIFQFSTIMFKQRQMQCYFFLTSTYICLLEFEQCNNFYT